MKLIFGCRFCSFTLFCILHRDTDSWWVALFLDGGGCCAIFSHQCHLRSRDGGAIIATAASGRTGHFRPPPSHHHHRPFLSVTLVVGGVCVWRHSSSRTCLSWKSGGFVCLFGYCQRNTKPGLQPRQLNCRRHGVKQQSELTKCFFRSRSFQQEQQQQE